MDKKCFKCKATKPIDQFPINRTTKDGHHTYCKQCECIRMAAYRKTPRGQEVQRLNNRKRMKFSNARWDATRRKKKWEWTITKTEFYELVALPCFYCMNKIGKTTGLDRTDNTKGYTLENVVPCCRECNTIKNDQLSKDEMLVVIQLVLMMRGLWDYPMV